MLKFSNRSLSNLKGVHPDLVLIHEHVLSVLGFDHVVTSGVRTDAEQFALYKQGRANVGGAWIVTDKKRVVTNCDGTLSRSNHQAKADGLGHATDSYPFPVDINNTARFHEMAQVFRQAAQELKAAGKIKHDLIWGGDWISIVDLPHFELK